MAKFCSKCGTALAGDEKFCTKCGAAVRASEPPKPVCPHCGKEMKPTSKFCPHCGKLPTAPRGSTEPTGPAAQAARPAVESAVRTVQTAAAQIPGLDAFASAAPGAVAVDIPDFSGMAGGALGQAEAILSPIRTLGGSVAGFFRNIGNIGKDRKARVGAILMAVVWIATWLWNRSGLANSASELLSAVTFAEGGTRGTLGQAVGGMFGKGLVMSAFASLFSGGLKGLFRGVGKVFSKGLNIGSAVFGLGAAALLYYLFAGYAGTYGAAVAVSGAVLSLQALGGRLGSLRSLAVSLTAKRVGDTRQQNSTKLKSLLTGAALGFMLSAALSGSYIPWEASVSVMVVGLIPGLISNFKEKVEMV